MRCTSTQVRRSGPKKFQSLSLWLSFFIHYLFSNRSRCCHLLLVLWFSGGVLLAVVGDKLEELLSVLFGCWSCIKRGCCFERGRSIWSCYWSNGLSQLIMVTKIGCMMGGCGGCVGCKKEAEGSVSFRIMREKPCMVWRWTDNGGQNSVREGQRDIGFWFALSMWGLKCNGKSYKGWSTTWR